MKEWQGSHIKLNACFWINMIHELNHYGLLKVVCEHNQCGLLNHQNVKKPWLPLIWDSNLRNAHLSEWEKKWWFLRSVNLYPSCKIHRLFQIKEFASTNSSEPQMGNYFCWRTLCVCACFWVSIDSWWLSGLIAEFSWWDFRRGLLSRADFTQLSSCQRWVRAQCLLLSSPGL